MQQRKQLPTDIDISKLIDIASDQEAKEQPAEVDLELLKSINNQGEMLAFLNFFDVKPGDYEVSEDVMFVIYKNWKRDALGKLMNKTMFKALLEDFIVSERKNNKRYYKISKDKFKLSEQAILELAKNFVTSRTRMKRQYGRIRHFDTFIQWLGLERGEDRVRSTVIFFFYDYWTYNTNKRSQGQSIMVEFLKDKFEYKRTTNDRFFLIDLKKLKVSEEQLRTASGWADGYEKKNKSKKATKKKN